MPFGKFKGYEIEEIEPQYLEWLVENVPLRGPLKRAVFEAVNTLPYRDEIEAPAPERVKVVFRELAMKYHPDRGGNEEAQKALNEFYERLR